MSTPPVWTSEHEHRMSAGELEAVRALEARDAEVGSSAAKRFGRELPPYVRPRGVRRIVLGVRRRLGGAGVGTFARKVKRRAAREAWRARRRLSAPAAPAASASGAFTVAAEPATAADAAHLFSAATTPFLVLLRGGGELTEAGAVALDEAIAEQPDVVLFTGDSLSPTGVRFRAPEFSPFRLRSEDTLGPVVAVSLEWAKRLGDLGPASDGRIAYDLALRAPADRARRLRTPLGIGAAVVEPAGVAAQATADLVQRRLAGLGVAAAVDPIGRGRRAVRYAPAPSERISVVIPTRGGAGVVGGIERVFVVEAIRGLVERAPTADLEFVVVADDATPQQVVDELGAIAGSRLRLVRWSEPFDFSAKMNLGAAAATGELLLLLNDDVELIEPASLARMADLLAQPGVGLVGALLFFEDGSIQHVGHLYQDGAAGHSLFGVMPGALHPMEQIAVTREVSGVTAACAIIRASDFAAIGGFSRRFPGNYNDVDLSLKVRDRGLAVLVTGDARFYHFESKTRDATVLPSESRELAGRWAALLDRDEYSRDQER